MMMMIMVIMIIVVMNLFLTNLVMMMMKIIQIIFSFYRYIPVLMAQAKIYWDLENFAQVEKVEYSIVVYRLLKNICILLHMLNFKVLL